MTPVIQILKGGQDLMLGLAPFFLSATITDAVGETNDQIEIVLDDRWRQIPIPREGDVLTVLAGYRERGMALVGAFAVQGWSTGWEGDQAETMTITARAADFGDPELKSQGSAHWDETTLGAIFDEVAGAAGLEAAVDPEIAGLQVPYALRWEASPIDFASRLAAENGGAVKAAGGRLAVVKKGSGRAADGRPLPPILVSRIGSGGWRAEGEPRPRHGAVAASWHDPETNLSEMARQETGLPGPLRTLLHPRPSEAEAERAAEAGGRELAMATGSATFAGPYDPAWSAGAPVIAVGFGPGVDGRWMSESIESTFDKEGGAVSTISCKADPSGRT